MDASDFLVTPFYILLIYYFAYRYKSRNLAGTDIGKYFIPGLTVKFIGAITAGLIYLFYYKGGDTLFYFADSHLMWIALLRDPITFFEILLLKSAEFTPDTFIYTRNMVYFNTPSAFFVVKISALISLICLNSFMTVSIIFAAISFGGSWALYMCLTDQYPSLHKKLAIAILFIPSVFFWGSGLFKDTVTFGCLGYLTYGFYNLFIKNRKHVQSIVLIIICSYMITQIKTYIILSLLPGLLFWIFLNFKSKLRTSFLQLAFTPLLVIISIGVSYVFVREIGAEFEKFSLENIASTAQTMQNWHGYISDQVGGSGYKLGSGGTSTADIIGTLPAAVNVTLFRPYIWEVKNVFMLMTSLESTLMLIFTIVIVIQARIFQVFRIMNGNPVVFFCIFFSLLFAFAVGYSTYNFGALARYKIPCLPFYLAGLFMIQYHLAALKKQRFAAESRVI